MFSGLFCVDSRFNDDDQLMAAFKLLSPIDETKVRCTSRYIANPARTVEIRKALARAHSCEAAGDRGEAECA